MVLWERTLSGFDPFQAPIYSEVPVTVNNVLVTPLAAEEQTSSENFHGSRLAYELSIPKGDTHRWENSRVEFLGRNFRSYGPVTEYPEALLPLDWGRKVKVERFDN